MQKRQLVYIFDCNRNNKYKQIHEIRSEQQNRTQANDDEQKKMFGKNNNLFHRIFWSHISVVFRSA